MDERQRDPLVGVIIDGRYLVRSRLARGGMSTVYLALDRRLEREVALKVMLPHLAEDPVLVERFEREAKTAARLAHPQVVQVLDQGHDEAGTDVLAYLVMEVVPGHTLRRVIREDAPLPPAAALRIIEAVLDGLSAAHEIGIMHRDVKPENVLVSPAGHIKVADFGLSRATTAHTSSGQSLVGTVAYLSPELVSGASADARSDVYAVGIVLYELLTGQQPYTAANPVQVATQHLHRRVPPPSRLVASVPEALDDLVLWCTEKDPALRPADATAVLREVQRLRAEPAVALETVPVPSTAPAARDHPDDDAAADAAEDAEVLIDADAESTHVRALDDAEAGRESAPTVAVRRADDETVALHRADDDAVALQRASDEALALNRPAAETVALPRRTAETVALPRHAADDVRDSTQPPAAPAHQHRGPLSVDHPPVAREDSSRGSSATAPSRRAQRRAAQRPVSDIGTGMARTLAIGLAVTLLLTGMAMLLGWTLGAGHVPFSTPGGGL